MKLRILALCLALAAGLFGQHRRFSWQDACFKNPAAPYCPGHEFAIKPTPMTKDAGPHLGTNPDAWSTTPESVTPSVITVGGIDWRFADPLADGLAGFNFSKVSASPLARSLMVQLGASQGLTEADMRKIFDGLSSAGQIALSARGDQMVVMITGRATDSTPPALEAGWKAVPVVGNAMLIGHAEAVDLAVQRMGAQGPLAELARLAEQRQSDSEFWAAGSGKWTGGEAVSASVKRFALTASLRDRLISDAAFEFDGVPDANALRMWPGATIDGNFAYVNMSLEGDEVQQKFGQIAASFFGQRLGALIKVARYLPVRDTTAGHTKPVIYGLDGGPKELKQ